MQFNHIPREPFGIKDCEWFGLLTESQQRHLLSESSTIEYCAGEKIVKQGFSASYLLFLERGFVKLNVENRGRVTTFKFVKEGNFIGLMCSFVNKTLDFSAVAVSDCSVIMINRSIFETLIRDNGEFAVYTVKMMSELTNGVVHNLINLSHKNVNGAVATLLCDMSELFGDSSFSLPFTRSEMADALGYSKESIINTLSDFQRDGVITVSAKRVKIENLGALEKIAKNG